MDSADLKKNPVERRNHFEIFKGSLAQLLTNGGIRGQQTTASSSQPGTDIAANQFFVSPSGSATGAGSITSPWDLKTALVIRQPSNLETPSIYAAALIMSRLPTSDLQAG